MNTTAVSAWEASMEWPDRLYADGYDGDGAAAAEDTLQAAVETAAGVDVALIFAGLPESIESEGYDRPHMKRPDCQNRLIEEVAKRQKNVVVILHNGSPVEMLWLEKVETVLETYLAGEGSGHAVAKILTGEVNPSGRLPETFPLRLEHNPSYQNFPGEGDITKYQEEIFVGYRYYETKKLPVLFPFGYGVSYTKFDYTDLALDKMQMQETETLHVSVTVKNTGCRRGKEVVQLYVEPVFGEQGSNTVRRPERELRAFEKEELEAGESKTIKMTLEQRAFAYYHTGIEAWYTAPGVYRICIGKNAGEMILSKTVTITSERKLPLFVTRNTPLIDLVTREETRDLTLYTLERVIPERPKGGSMEAWGQKAAASWMQFMPLREMVSFYPDKMNFRVIDELIDKINNKSGN